MGLWECADVDVLCGKRCFAVESSQGKEVMSWADWPFWPLPSSPPRHHPLCLWFTLHFQRGSLRADTLDATPLGRSSQILTKICPLSLPLAPRVTWEGLLSRGWRLTIGCGCREPRGVGLFPITAVNSARDPQKRPDTSYVHTHKHTHLRLAGWACCFLKKQEASWLSTYQHSLVCFCLFGVMSSASLLKSLCTIMTSYPDMQIE